ncbi:MAG: KaiC 1, partial [Burkholderiales bacterium]|nr:KaiC 1 [Flavobacterium sp.]
MNKTAPKKSPSPSEQLQKCPTGITGFDEITEGGLPKNRTTLVSGGAGSGKTLLGLDFLIN